MAGEQRRFRYFGPKTPLTPMAQLVMDEDIAGLDAALGTAWSLNTPFQFCEHCHGLAIELALVENKQNVVDYLLSKKADLNAQGSPAMVSAVGTLDTALMDKLIAAGADATAVNNVGYNAMMQAVAWGHVDLVPYLESRGLAFTGPGGEALEIAVFDEQLELVDYMLRQGADPNRGKSPGHGGVGETPLHMAVYRGNMDMARLLIGHGADPGRPDRLGRRPYLSAMGMGYNELAAYLRGLEPAQWHDRQQQTALAQEFGAPAELIEFLSRGAQTLGVMEDGSPAIFTLPIEDIYVLTAQGGTYLALSLKVADDMPMGEIVWSKAHSCICVIETEHDELFEVGSWGDFARRPIQLLESIWNG